MNNFIIIEDSRQQIGKHRLKLKYFKEQGIKTIRSKLFVGDLARLDNQTVCIDTKKDVLEIAQNICGKNHDRFRDECIRAKENGIKLIILIEEENSIENLKNWKSPTYKYGINKDKPFTQIWGITISKAMQTFQIKYGVQFMFCDKHDSGKIIVDILSEV